MDVTLIEATPADFPSLFAWMAELRRADPMEADGAAAENDSREAMRLLVSDPTLGRVWTMRVDGAAVGYAALTFCMSIEFGGKIGFLDEFYVAPTSRRQGIGRRAIEMIQAAGAALGIVMLALEVSPANLPAMQLYESTGFLRRKYQMFMKSC